jgi:hypothetical protein
MMAKPREAATLPHTGQSCTSRERVSLAFRDEPLITQRRKVYWDADTGTSHARALALWHRLTPSNNLALAHLETP